MLFITLVLIIVYFSIAVYILLFTPIKAASPLQGVFKQTNTLFVREHSLMSEIREWGHAPKICRTTTITHKFNTFLGIFIENFSKLYKIIYRGMNVSISLYNDFTTIITFVI